MKNWSGVQSASEPGPACPQRGNYPPESAVEPTSEDCLFLNVWAPASVPDRPLPVMVWLHGGGLENGSGSNPLYAGDQLSKRGVILVTANYRLGVLGFLSHPELSRESPEGVSGNYGLLDQIAVLQWVQRNIRSFGGDPGNVTIFGQSSGAISVSALVTSPLAHGLFHRAIAQSGGLFEPLVLDRTFWQPGADEQGVRLANRVGAPDIAALRDVPVARLLSTPFRTHFTIDGFALQQAPFDVYADQEHHDVDLLLGSNADEGQLFIADKNITVDNFTDVLSADFPKVLVWMVRPERGTSDAEARSSAATFNGAMRFQWDMWTWARLAAVSATRKVYLYNFARSPQWVAGQRYFGLGATHGMELPYVFEHLASDRAIAADIAQYWVNFASHGDPNGPGLKRWEAFRPASRSAMTLGETMTMEPIANLGQLQRIDRIYGAIRFTHRYRFMLLAIALVIASAVAAYFLDRMLVRRGSVSSCGRCFE